MRIGIDATALPDRPVGGGRYIIHLIRAMAQIPRQFELIVFVQSSRKHLLDISDDGSIEWIVVPDMIPWKRLIWEQVRLPVMARKTKLDLLHSTHYTRPAILPCASVISFHDMTFFLRPDLHVRSKRIFFPIAIRYSAIKADHILASSENTRQDALRILGMKPERISTIPLGVNSAYGPNRDSSKRRIIREKYNLPDEFILYVGLVEPRKNLTLLIRSYKRLVQSGIEIPLVIVGRLGWMYQDLLNSIEEWGLKDKVMMTGYIPEDDLPEVYRQASVLAYPSLYEGFGFPPLEAMACGTPVVTTDISSLPEVVGEAGILVPPNDEESLCQALADVLTQPLLQQTLIEKGYQQASFFTWERTARSTAEIYHQVVSDK